MADDNFDALLDDLEQSAAQLKQQSTPNAGQFQQANNELEAVSQITSSLGRQVSDETLYATADPRLERLDAGLPSSSPGYASVNHSAIYATPHAKGPESVGIYTTPRADEEYSIPQTLPQDVGRHRIGPSPPARAPDTQLTNPPRLNDQVAGLDSLMADLATFDASPSTQPPSQPPSKAPGSRMNTLPKETMPSSLPPIPVEEASVNLPAVAPGTTPTKQAKGVCAMCKHTILGQILTALDMEFHPGHFMCAKCNRALGAATFFEHDGLPYCANDYHEMYSPRCGYCNEPIVGRFISAIGKKWHRDCFFCSQCGKSFDDGSGFMEKDGRAYCQADYYNMFAPKCAKCQLPIMADTISALGQSWHPACFVCAEPSCGAAFPEGNFFESNNKPYCAMHFHSARGSLCQKCQEPIVGKCITALGHKYHPDCFGCHFCLKNLEQGVFQEKEGNPYCNTCFVKLYG